MNKLRDFRPMPLKDVDKYKEELSQLHRKVPYVRHLGSRTEAVCLHQLAAGFFDNCDGHILEFGTFMGWSTVALATGMQNRNDDKMLFTVDPYTWHSEALPIAFASFKKLGLQKKICQVLWNDLDFVRSLWVLPARMIFVDGDHGHRTVKETLDLCFPLVQRGGWLVLHDYNKRSEVAPAAHEWLDNTNWDISVFLIDSLLCLRKNG